MFIVACALTFGTVIIDDTWWHLFQQLSLPTCGKPSKSTWHCACQASCTWRQLIACLCLERVSLQWFIFSGTIAIALRCVMLFLTSQAYSTNLTSIVGGWCSPWCPTLLPEKGWWDRSITTRSFHICHKRLRNIGMPLSHYAGSLQICSVSYVRRYVCYSGKFVHCISYRHVHSVGDILTSWIWHVVTAAILPGNNASSVYPFQSLLINFNIHTKAHRDSQDQTFCLVIPIGSFEDGELCMIETWLVMGLRLGDWIMFCSADVTHFNMHFKGWRALLVMYTNRAMDRWLDNRNGWYNNSTFNWYPCNIVIRHPQGPSSSNAGSMERGDAVNILPGTTKIVIGSNDWTACGWLLSTAEQLLSPLKHNHWVVATKFLLWQTPHCHWYMGSWLCLDLWQSEWQPSCQVSSQNQLMVEPAPHLGQR